MYNASMTLSDRAIRHLDDHTLWADVCQFMMRYLTDEPLTAREYVLLCRLSRELQRRGRKDPRWMGCTCEQCVGLWERQQEA